jgi:hypothetical protein
LPPEEVVRFGSRLVGVDALQRWAARVREQSAKHARANPYWQRPRLEHVIEWCGQTDKAIAGAILKEALSRTLPQVSATTLSPGDERCAAALLARSREPEPILLSEAQAQYPSHLHVITWLTDAGKLISSPYGVLFDSSQLEEFALKLRGKLKPGDPIPVGMLKLTLAIGRRKAMALKDVLVARPGLLKVERKSPAVNKSAVVKKDRQRARSRHA